MSRTATILAMLFWAATFWAQSLPEREHLAGEFLVKLRTGVAPDKLVEANRLFRGRETGLRAAELLSAPLNIWLLRGDLPADDEKGLLTALNRHLDVEAAQFNYVVQPRGNCSPLATLPNDPQFGQQWQYINTGAGGGVADADIDAELAWDITTGGLTALGDTIVVCIVDDGVDVNHPDMAPNLWRNWSEIPGNGLDDDGNGYVDDFRGWNAPDNNDDIANGFFGGGHGTPVAGIVGAKGDNGIGVSGVNWNIKLMIVVNGGPYTSANVIEAYSYPYSMRLRYNQTGGAEGAFVVATNSSWGIDYGQPADEPLWCAFYDSLGSVGILNCGAGPNANIDVDTQGDLPTACPSDWLVAVTNMNRSDVKLVQAGYGQASIDLGAFGQDTWTVADNAGYEAFGGTSGATPHVAGAVALLYSAPCPALAALAKIAPDQAALLVKQYILDGTDPNVSLAGITSTGGRLNLYGALQELLANCPADTSCLPAFGIQVQTPNDTTIALSWSALDTPAFSVVRYREVGAAVWDSLIATGLSAQIAQRTACTVYEFQIGLWCDSSTFSGYSIPRTVRTTGCCEAPVSLSAVVADSASAWLYWSNVPAGTAYVVEYLPNGGAWTALPPLTADSLLLQGLSSCTEYRFRISRACADGTQTPPTGEEVFRTLGCGNCVDLAYCSTAGDDPTYEWIGSTSFGNYTNASGNDGGYVLFTATGIEWARGAQYPFSLSPQFSGQAYTEVFRIWLDADQNGQFDDPAERLYESNPTNGPVNGNLAVPIGALPGLTRLRVTMSWDNPAAACGPYDYGETEDYCVTILDSMATGLSEPLGAESKLAVFPNPTEGGATLSLWLRDRVEAAWAEVFNAQGQRVLWQPLGGLAAGGSVVALSGVSALPTGIYAVRVQLPGESRTVAFVKR